MTATNTGPQPAIGPLLTEASESELRILLEQVEGNRLRIRNKRDEHEREIDARRQEIRSLETVDSLLAKTADDYRRALGETVPQPADAPQVEFPPPPPNPFDVVPDLSADADTHMAAFLAQHDAQAAREGVSR
jgi:hypothetical protein